MGMTDHMDTVALRDMIQADLPVLFEQQADPQAVHMAAFTSERPTDREAYMAHFRKVLGNPSIVKKTVLCNGEVAGSILKFELFNEPCIGYGLGREFWGRGIMTRALTEFLKGVSERPLYARAAHDNAASIRVLQKCGFTITGKDHFFANARGEEIEEVILTLR